jgi:hypothetical protein
MMLFAPIRESERGPLVSAAFGPILTLVRALPNIRMGMPRRTRQIKPRGKPYSASAAVRCTGTSHKQFTARVSIAYSLQMLGCGFAFLHDTTDVHDVAGSAVDQRQLSVPVLVEFECE